MSCVNTSGARTGLFRDNQANTGAADVCFKEVEEDEEDIIAMIYITITSINIILFSRIFGSNSWWYLYSSSLLSYMYTLLRGRTLPELKSGSRWAVRLTTTCIVLTAFFCSKNILLIYVS